MHLETTIVANPHGIQLPRFFRSALPYWVYIRSIDVPYVVPAPTPNCYREKKSNANGQFQSKLETIKNTDHTQAPG